MAYAWEIFDFYNEVRDLIWPTEDVKIDTLNMRMNYKTMTSFLLLSSCLVTCHKWFGGKKPIECISNVAKPPPYLDDFCWIHPKKISVEKETWSEESFEERIEDIMLARMTRSF